MSIRVGVGDTVWVFTANGGVYQTRVAAPVPCGWRLGDGSTVSASGGAVREGHDESAGQWAQVAMTRDAMDDMMWVKHDAPALAEAIEQCENPNVLRRIAALLDYTPRKRP